MRCLTLAEALRKRGASITFVSAQQEGCLCDLIVSRGFTVSRITPATTAKLEHAWREDASQTRAAIQGSDSKPEWLIVDSYALDHRWESALRGTVTNIMVIDDLANRRHDCDVILDQNYFESAQGRYEHLVPAGCLQALGPQFALLREEFYEARKAMRERDGTLRRILVAFGGSDPANETGKVLAALDRPAFRDLKIDVVIGGLNPNSRVLLARYGTDPRLSFHQDVTNMATLMSTADLSIGAGGTMHWERSSLGLPSVVIVIAKNQAETSAALHRAGMTQQQIASVVERLSNDPVELLDMGRKSIQVMALGTANEPRILSYLFGSNI
jgi:UDP-2,4-diacetamido-2,4,6-trideoxy-beta-L-altropyranose hydrolase